MPSNLIAFLAGAGLLGLGFCLYSLVRPATQPVAAPALVAAPATPGLKTPELVPAPKPPEPLVDPKDPFKEEMEVLTLKDARYCPRIYTRIFYGETFYKDKSGKIFSVNPNTGKLRREP